MKKSIITIIALALLALQLVSTLETTVEVPNLNLAPIQLQNIPDQSWPMNKNVTDSFDLDDYFIDYEDTITYNFTQVQNITIIINQTTNVVSFYSDENFTGTRNVTFTASDGFASTDSNLVRINVTDDNQSPKWANLSMDQISTNISQNTVVTFSANWTDNLQLSYYIFSINQGSGWVNFTQSFSGVSNTSIYSISISAAAGTNVLWMFYAYDTSNNYNYTSTEFFTVMTRTTTSNDDDDSSSSSRARARGGQAPTVYKSRTVLKGFEVVPDNLAVELKQGESITKLIKINNLALRETNFTMKLEGLEDYITISENNFSIKSGNSAVLALLFATSRKSVPDIYFGKLIITTPTERIDVPIVLTINPLVFDFEVKVELDDKYKIMNPGETIEARISLINKKDLLYENITLYYAVMDFFGQVIDHGQEEINFSESIIRLNRNITIPLDAEPGDHIFYARATKENKAAMDLEEFIIGKKFSIFSFLVSNIIYIIIALIFIITLLLFVYYHKTKEKERLLNLYIMINELRKLIEENKLDEAIMQYNRIKLAYNEKIGKPEEQNKEEIKSDMQRLIVDFNSLNNVKKLKIDIEKSKTADKKEEAKSENAKEIKEDKKEKSIKKKIKEKKKVVKKK